MPDGSSGPALFLLGGVELRGVPSSDADRLLSQSKVVALLAYLALSPPGRYQRRDRLVGLLWPELDQAHARAALRKAVHAIRTTLGAQMLTVRGDEDLAIASGALWCDVAEFIACTDGGRLGRALELYRDEIMPGFHLPGCSEYDLWLADQRASARERSRGPTSACCAAPSACWTDWAIAQGRCLSLRTSRSGCMPSSAPNRRQRRRPSSERCVGEGRRIDAAPSTACVVLVADHAKRDDGSSRRRDPYSFADMLEQLVGQPAREREDRAVAREPQHVSLAIV